MKDYDSISWRRGEGLPSRDQVKEKREYKKQRRVFVRGRHRKVLCHIEVSIQSLCTCT